MTEKTKRDVWMAANKPSKAEVNASIARAEHVLQVLLDSGLKVVLENGEVADPKEVLAVLAGAVA